MSILSHWHQVAMSYHTLGSAAHILFVQTRACSLLRLVIAILVLQPYSHASKVHHLVALIVWNWPVVVVRDGNVGSARLCFQVDGSIRSSLEEHLLVGVHLALSVALA